MATNSIVNRTAIETESSGQGTVVRFESSEPSSMVWTQYIGAVCEFNVNDNKVLVVDREMMSELACHTPLAGKMLLIMETDPWYVTHHEVPKYLVYDTDEMDEEEFAERCPGYS